jgi:hypothetical protein
MKIRSILSVYSAYLNYIVIMTAIMQLTHDNISLRETCELSMLYNTCFHLLLVIILILSKLLVRNFRLLMIFLSNYFANIQR